LLVCRARLRLRANPIPPKEVNGQVYGFVLVEIPCFHQVVFFSHVWKPDIKCIQHAREIGNGEKKLFFIGV